MTKWEEFWTIFIEPFLIVKERGSCRGFSFSVPLLIRWERLADRIGLAEREEGGNTGRSLWKLEGRNSENRMGVIDCLDGSFSMIIAGKIIGI